jgi:hypothetical protein
MNRGIIKEKRKKAAAKRLRRTQQPENQLKKLALRLFFVY